MGGGSTKTCNDYDRDGCKSAGGCDWKRTYVFGMPTHRCVSSGRSINDRMSADNEQPLDSLDVGILRAALDKKWD